MVNGVRSLRQQVLFGSIGPNLRRLRASSRYSIGSRLGSSRRCAKIGQFPGSMSGAATACLAWLRSCATMQQAIARGAFMCSVRLVMFVVAVLLTAALPATAEVLIAVDTSAQRMTVVVDGAVRWIWPVSTGRRGYATPSGSYTAFRMEEEHYSQEWDDAPMPYSIFFTKRGHAIHGSDETRRLGTPMSHGCVRLHPDNAAKLYVLVERMGVTNATVVVTDGDD
jgi:hypothetical protein